MTKIIFNYRENRFILLLTPLVFFYNIDIITANIIFSYLFLKTLFSVKCINYTFLKNIEKNVFILFILSSIYYV